MEFRSSQVLAYVITKAKSNGASVSTAKSQRLLYICYGAVLSKFGKRLTDEHPAALQHGPAFPRALSDMQKGRLTTPMVEAFKRQCPTEVLELIDRAIRRFESKTANELSSWSKKSGSPWAKAAPGEPLSDAYMEYYFCPYLPLIEADSEEDSDKSSEQYVERLKAAYSRL